MPCLVKGKHDTRRNLAPTVSTLEVTSLKSVLLPSDLQDRAGGGKLLLESSARVALVTA